MEDKIIEIQHKSNEDIYPHFGYYHHEKSRIRIRNDLPISVYNYVLMYNLLHVGFDYKTGKKWPVIIEEITSLFAALLCHPIGGIRTIFMITRSDRIKLWYAKWKERK